ncbi:MAG: biopolymer transporter ExbD [Verrucomicrobiales bacterium]|nr:biopolymer transporter ExbD [Verrucomicrobiales bacterium]HQW29255.1 biopolymer transporter ExbD [Verrucomicrobiales bacterium]
MKLESTLSDRAGMLYTAPLVDVILLLIIFFLFGSNLVLKSGVEVNLPSSSSSLPSAEDAHIITLIPTETAEFYFNDERVDIEKLAGKLEEALKRSNQVVILGDEAVDYGVVMGIARLVLNSGFEVSFATKMETP